MGFARTVRACKRSAFLACALTEVLAQAQDRSVAIGTRFPVELNPAVRGVQVSPLDDRSERCKAESWAVFADSEPVGWLRPADSGVLPGRIALPGVVAPKPGWAWPVPAQFTASLLDDWPAQTTVTAELDSVGPGLRSAWILAGARMGVVPGDSWWLRVGGQPIARFDVRATEPDLSFCAVTPLVSQAELFTGDRVEAWPAPGDAQSGLIRSAVAYVEDNPSGQFIWIAAPPRAEASAEPQIEVYRAGRFVGHGVVERQDERFWYARFWPAAIPVEPAAHTSNVPPPAQSQPASSPGATSQPVARSYGEKWDIPPIQVAEPAKGEHIQAAWVAPPKPAPPEPLTGVEVGDEVRIRSAREIALQSFAARVFEQSDVGPLINAGEVDGLTLGEVGQIERDGRTICQATVVRLQRTFALVRAELGCAIHVGDEMRFGPPPPPVERLGVLTAVADQTLFTARIGDVPVPRLRPLTLRLGDEVVGVGVVLACERGLAYGFAVDFSLTHRLLPGMELVRRPP